MAYAENNNQEINESDVEFKHPKKEKKEKKKHYWWRFLLCFLGGFLFAFLSVAGGVAIVGTVMTTSDVVSMFGGNPDEVLGAEYKNSTLLNMAIVLSQKQFDTLEDLNDVSPLVKYTFDNEIVPVIRQNLHFEISWETLSTASFTAEGENNIGNVIQREVYNGVKIVDFINGSENLNKLYKFFLYDVVRDENNQPVRDENGNVTLNETEAGKLTLGKYAEGAAFLNDIMTYITIGDVIPDADTSTNPIIIALKDTTINNIQDRVNTLTVGELFTDEQKASNPLIADDCLGGKTLSQLGDAETINGIKINALLTNRNALSNLMKVIYDLDLTVGELKSRDLTQDIRIGDIFPNSDNKIIIALQDHTISELSNESTINSLKLSDILDITDPESFLWDYKDYTISELKTINPDGGVDLDTIKVFSFFSTEQIDANPLLKALYDSNPDLTVKQLSDYDVIATIPLGSILGDVSGNPVLSALVEKGATIKNLSTVVNSLTVADVLGQPVGDHSIQDNIITALGEYPITEIADHFDDLTLGDVIYITDASPIVLRSLQNTTLADLSNDLSELTVGQCIEIAPGSTLDKENIKNVVISDAASFEEALKNNLTLGDILDIDESSPKLLRTLKDYALSELDEQVANLTFSQVMDIDLTSPETSPILKAIQNAKIFGEDEDSLIFMVNNLKFNQVFTEEECSSGFMKLLWDGDGDEAGDFQIKNISEKGTSIVTSKTLYDLYDAGLLDIGARSTLDKTVQGEPVGNMTISQFLTAALAVLPNT